MNKHPEPTLFPPTEGVINKRPTEITAQQKQDFYKKVAQEIIKYQYSTDDEESIIEDIEQLEIRSWNSGFDLANDLKKDGTAQYEFSGDFINYLDDLMWEQGEILEENVKLWVLAHNPQPKFTLGQKLTIIKTLNHEKQAGQIVYITGVKTETANYLVDKDAARQGGTVITYEKVEECCEIKP